MGRFKKRYILTSIFLGQFEKAFRLSSGDPQMIKITSELVKHSSHFRFDSIETEFSHVFVVTSKDLCSRYCWVHLLLDSCKRRGSDKFVSRLTLQDPSFFELNVSLASLAGHEKILVLFECENFDVSNEDFLPTVRRGALIQLMFLKESVLKTQQLSSDSLLNTIINSADFLCQINQSQ
jgi:hypothetical protein